MTYNYKEGILVPFVQKFYKQMIIVVAGLFIASMAAMTFNANAAPKNPGSNGKVTFDTDVAWDGTEMYYGDGIPNGEWVVAEVQGVELGVRITDRTDGPLDVVGDKGNRVGVYEASTGYDGTTADRAEWNYEWSVDLSNAKGNASGRTLTDYNLFLEQDADFYGQGNDTLLLPMPVTCDTKDNPRTDTLCQQSWNPLFGDTDFNVNEENTYNLRFVLTPKTFKGPSVTVAVQVNVVNNN